MTINILYPALTLIGLTLFCLGRLGILRYMAVRDRNVDPKYYELYRGEGEPEKIRAQSRHVTNLFEAPMLFYAISLFSFVSGSTTQVAVFLAWTYVFLRYLHSYIHLTSNIVIRRFSVYAASTLVLTLMWLNVIVTLIRQ